MNAAIAEALVVAGMSHDEAARKEQLFAKAESVLRARGVPSTRCWFVPGRIEVLGKHTDYAGGRSLLCTAERGMCIVANPRDDSTVRISDAVDGRSVEFELSAGLAIPESRWTVYTTSVGRRIARNFGGELRGADIAIANDLPRAAGMSSSSVLVVAIFSVLSEINRLDQRPEYKSNIRNREELAGYLGCIENGQTFGSLAGDKGVGTFGGSEDHTAIICSQPGMLRQYSFCPVRAERIIKLPAECTFVIATSGVKASKIGAARGQYNRISKAAEAVLALWRTYSGENPATLRDAVTSSLDAPARIREALEHSSISDFSPQALLDRFDQFVLESEEIIPAAGDALSRADLQSFGDLVDRSQRAAERWLGNQIAETIELARVARQLGAYAASSFGAGFGGSVWSLVSRAEAFQFRDAWKKRYEQLFPEAAAHSQFFVTAPGPACSVFS
jgi:galactokinase